MIRSSIFKRLKHFFSLTFISKINFKLLITIVCLLFLGASIYSNLDALASQKIDDRTIYWIFIAIILSFFSILINAYAWNLLINSLGLKKIKLNAVEVFINTNIYKYLPGGIWHFVSRFNTLRLHMSIKDSAESILLEPLLMLVSGLFFIPFASWDFSILFLCWSSPLIFLNKPREVIIGYLKNLKSSIFNEANGLNQLNYLNDLNISNQTYYPYKALFVELVFILFRFLGFYCCLNGFSIGSIISYGELISCFSFSWIIGLIVPAAPGGLGVFETAVLFSLGSKLPEAPLLGALLFYRLVATMADILVVFIYPLKKILSSLDRT